MLHAWIRFFEYFLHLAYRLEFKTWQVNLILFNYLKLVKKKCILYILYQYKQVKAVHKDVFNKRKKFIQNKFRSEMGLLVDVVLQGMYLFYIPITLNNYTFYLYIVNTK